MPKKLSVEQVVEMIRDEARKCGSLGKLARKWRVSPQYLQRMVRVVEHPGDKVRVALGLRRVTRVSIHYERVEP